MNKTLAVMYLPYGIIVPITMVVDKNLVPTGSLELDIRPGADPVGHEYTKHEKCNSKIPSKTLTLCNPVSTRMFKTFNEKMDHFGANQQSS